MLHLIDMIASDAVCIIQMQTGGHKRDTATALIDKKMMKVDDVSLIL